MMLAPFFGEALEYWKLKTLVDSDFEDNLLRSLLDAPAHVVPGPDNCTQLLPLVRLPTTLSASMLTASLPPPCALRLAAGWSGPVGSHHVRPQAQA